MIPSTWPMVSFHSIAHSEPQRSAHLGTTVLCINSPVRWGAAVAAAGMFGLGVVGCGGLVIGAVANGELALTALAVPVLFLCGSAGVWIMNRFGVAAGVLGRPAVFVPGSLLSVALFLLLVL